MLLCIGFVEPDALVIQGTEPCALCVLKHVSNASYIYIYLKNFCVLVSYAEWLVESAGVLNPASQSEMNAQVRPFSCFEGDFPRSCLFYFIVPLAPRSPFTSALPRYVLAPQGSTLPLRFIPTMLSSSSCVLCLCVCVG